MSLQAYNNLTNPPALSRSDSQKDVVLRPPLARVSILPRYTKKPQLILLQHVAEKILFSQKSVSDFSMNGKAMITLDDLADQLFVSFNEFGAIDIVANGDGTFTSVDNRRLLIAKRISQYDRNYSIYVRVHKAADCLKDGEKRRFTIGEFVPKTWGEAVRGRISQSGVLGFSKEPKILAKTVSTLSIDLSCLDLSALHKEDRENLLNRAEGLTIKV
jgi:hypothetical protein